MSPLISALVLVLVFRPKRLIRDILAQIGVIKFLMKIKDFFLKDSWFWRHYLQVVDRFYPFRSYQNALAKTITF